MNTNASPLNSLMPAKSFQIETVFAIALQKTIGIKAEFWKAFALLFIITIVSAGAAFFTDYLIMDLGFSLDNDTIPHPIAQIIQMVLSIFLTTPLFAGLMMMCIKHCRGEKVSFRLMFDYLPLWKKLWVYPAAMTILTLIPMATGDHLWIHIPLGIIAMFINTTYVMFVPLVADKNLPTWTALETSRKTIFHHWFKTLWFLILLVIMMVSSMLTLGILSIWTTPWAYCSIAILYLTLFEAQPKLGEKSC